jgi:site-specific DNA-methyltransferase (adenine-specific)
MEYLVKTYTQENDTVLDFTMGSGTTGVACKNLNRNFIGIEKDDKYFEIAKQRIGL